jgi:hypothetical protein
MHAICDSVDLSACCSALVALSDTLIWSFFSPHGEGSTIASVVERKQLVVVLLQWVESVGSEGALGKPVGDIAAS